MIEIPLTPADDDRPPPRLTKLAELLQDGVGVRSFVLTGLFLLAVLYTLYFAKEFLLPIFLAMMFTFLLVPVVRFLKQRLHLPEHIGAAIVMLGLVGILAGAVVFVSDPASEWLQTLPSKMPELETRLRLLKKPIAKVTAASAEVEKLATVTDPAGVKTQIIQAPQKSPVAVIMSQTPAFVANLFVMLILLYFLLASGNSFLRKLVTMTPKLRDKVRAVEISRDIEEKISKYLRVTFTINACLGLAVGTASYFVGLQNYILWGSLAFLFNFVPYVGALVGIVSILLVGLLTFPTTSHAFVMPGIYLAIAVLEGNFITPMIMGRFMTLNPVAIFISLMFWGWIWGIPGALLAVPMLAIVKILCDYIEPLEPIGEFLGS
ncbi:MAG: AI-2E family transporter [Chthoniobacterales bacterium]